jgi:acyl-CoA thioesterase-2
MAESEPTLELLRAIVGVELLDEGTAIGRTDLGGERPGLFGGQMISQALSACAHSVPDGAVPDSIHANLLGRGSSGKPVEFRVEKVRTGGALQHRDVRGYQNGEMIIHANVVTTHPSDGLDWQEDAGPDSGAPNQGHEAPQPWARNLGWGAFDVAYPTDHEGDGAWHPLWVRAAVEVPGDPWLQSAVLAFWSDFGMNGSVRMTNQRLGRTPSSVSATHSFWIHRPTDVTGWHHLDATTRSLAGNQGFVHAALHDGGGRLIGSIAQGVFIARPRNPTRSGA